MTGLSKEQKMSIKAIETEYKGYKFRSRLEAKWAVFFDAMGLAWEYEPEGFELSAGRYLPDFRVLYPGRWKSEERWHWVEVKPYPPIKDDPRHLEFACLADELILVWGIPDARFYIGYNGNGPKDDNLLIWSSKGRPWWVATDWDLESYCMEDKQYMAAVYAARQARFEHGAHLPSAKLESRRSDSTQSAGAFILDTNTPTNQFVKIDNKQFRYVGVCYHPCPNCCTSIHTYREYATAKLFDFCRVCGRTWYSTGLLASPGGRTVADNA